MSFLYMRLYASSFRARGEFVSFLPVFLLVFYFIGMILMMVYCFFSFLSHLFGGMINGLC